MQGQRNGGPSTSRIYFLLMVIASWNACLVNGGKPILLVPLDPALVAQARQVGLQCHNNYRAYHGSPPLVLDDVLNDQADQWSRDMAMKQRVAKGGATNNYTAANQTRRKKSGQNVESTYNLDLNASICGATDDFYKGICEYQGPTFISKKQTKDFTQLVWAETRQVGFGLAIGYKEDEDPTKKGILYITAEYFPMGNVNEDDYFIKNVRHVSKPEEVWELAHCTTSPPFDGSQTHKGESWVFRLVESPQPDALKAAREAALQRHNELRAQHGIAELQMDEVLNDRAQRWAEQREMAGAVGYDNKHYRLTGQNVYKGPNTTAVGYGVDVAIAAAVTATNTWYAEICNFEHGIANPSVFDKSFIHLVWDSAESVGFGIAMGYDKRRLGEISVVANYRPVKNLDDVVYLNNNSVANVRPPLNPQMVWDQQKCAPNSKGRLFLEQGPPFPVVIIGVNGTGPTQGTPSPNAITGPTGATPSPNVITGPTGATPSPNVITGPTGAASSSSPKP